jgi:hypothetical protein
MPGTLKVLASLLRDYTALKSISAHDACSNEVAKLIIRLTETSLDFLSSHCMKVQLTSKVIGKTYFSFSTKRGPHKLSRAVNEDLFKFVPDRRPVFMWEDQRPSE